MRDLLKIGLFCFAVLAALLTLAALMQCAEVPR